MPIGLAPFTIRYSMFEKADVASTYQKLQALGFGGVEGGIGRHWGYGAEEEKQLMDSYGMRLIDVWADPRKPDETMALADAYGTKLVCVGSVPNENLLSPEGFRAYARQLNELAKPFAAAGFTLSYHNHAQEFRNFAALGGRTGMDILIAETDPESVAFCLDIFWASAAGADPADWLRRLKGRTNLVHFKDYAMDDRSFETDMGRVPYRFAEIGQGNVNWKAVMEACRDIGIEWYCIEQDYTRGDAFDSLKTSVDYMRDTLGIES